MRTPGGPGAPRRTRFPYLRRHAVAIATIAIALSTVGSAAAVHLQVTHVGETLVGVQSPADFLAHWQQVGSLAAVTPVGVVRTWSVNAATPTRLPGVSSNVRLDRATAGDQAVVWVFNETVGIATSTEIEIAFAVEYTFGAVTTTTDLTVYVETQRVAPVATVTFTVYWDARHAAGVTWVNQLEIAQVCPAVGTCP
jgi:hypothetical protein